MNPVLNRISLFKGQNSHLNIPLVEYLNIHINLSFNILCDCFGFFRPAYTLLRLYVCFQLQTDIHVDTKQQTLQGVAFPMQREAIQALEQFREKRINYVQLVLQAFSPPPLPAAQYNSILSLLFILCSIHYIAFKEITPVHNGLNFLTDWLG